MSWHNLQRWRGVALVGVVVVATLLLAANNQLVLYIHPRYIVFTVIMMVIAAILIVASILLGGRGDEEDPPSRAGKFLGVTAVVLAGAVAIGMVVLPPATLSSATADQREINSSALGGSTVDVSEVAAGSDATFTAFDVLDWASLLRQTTDLGVYEDKPVDVVGFVTADQSDPDNVFYVSRFIVTCCAVDAQPVGVPVYLPDWKSTIELDEWVQVTGGFDTNRSPSSDQPLAVIPDEVIPTEQPSDPYLF